MPTMSGWRRSLTGTPKRRADAAPAKTAFRPERVTVMGLSEMLFAAASESAGVPILLVVPGQRFGGLNGDPVETTQIAPTILKLLHLDPNALQAVRIEHTRVLPGFDR